MEKKNVIKNEKELTKKIEDCTQQLNQKFKGENGKRSITICGGTGCLSSNSNSILEEFNKLIKEY